MLYPLELRALMRLTVVVYGLSIAQPLYGCQFDKVRLPNVCELLVGPLPSLVCYPNPLPHV